MPRKITAWSYSALSQYEKCPRQYKYARIDKLPQPESHALERGNILHAKAEQFVKGNIKGMPKELSSFQNELKELKRLCADTELDLSFTQNWAPTHGKDWNGVWCRAYLDASIMERDVGTVIDYKTGKIYPHHEEQGNLYGLATFIHFPKIKIVDIEFWYFDQGGHVESFSYNKKDLPAMKKDWKNRAAVLFRETKWAPKPGNHCRWCPFSNVCEAAE